MNSLNLGIFLALKYITLSFEKYKAGFTMRLSVMVNLEAYIFSQTILGRNHDFTTNYRDIGKLS